MNNKIKVCHIHTDPKFGMNQGFNHEMFDNRIYYLLSEYDFNGVQHNCKTGEKLLLSRASMRKVISAANECDVVVLYLLSTTTAYITKKLRKDIIVIWRFFGTELYGKLGNKMYSPLTLSDKSPNIPRSNLFSSIKEKLKLTYLYCWNLNGLFEEAVKRADAVAMLYQKEYDFLTKYFQLPKFIQLSYARHDTLSPDATKTKTIIIGNSRNRYNNHLDILEIVKDNVGDYRYELPFNYGMQSSYADAVYNCAKDLKQVHIIEDFMPYNEYQAMYNNAAVFVFNAYRQMAMGNIFIALQTGVKIYLNTRNTAYHWLKEEGFVVSTIEDFEKDLKTSNIFLTKGESLHNKQLFNELGNKYSSERFQQEVVALINKKNL